MQIRKTGVNPFVSHPAVFHHGRAFQQPPARKELLQI